MAYQPLYGRITDNCGGYAHSLVLRGKVKDVSYWLNSKFGEVMSVSSHLLEGTESVQRPDLRKVKKEHRIETLREYENDVKRANRVYLDIALNPLPEAIVRINGMEFSFERIKLLHDMQGRYMEKQIEWLRGMNDKRLLQMAELVTHGSR